MVLSRHAPPESVFFFSLVIIEVMWFSFHVSLSTEQARYRIGMGNCTCNFINIGNSQVRKTPFTKVGPYLWFSLTEGTNRLSVQAHFLTIRPALSTTP